jgi:tetratricopeptide (TPR) repeat protein
VTDPRRGAAGTDPAESVGERLRRLRLAAGLSQAALAGGDVHPSYVSLLESGRRSPTPAILAELSTRLGVPTAELAGDTGAGLDTALVLARSALGLGRPAEAVLLLDPLVAGVGVADLAGDPRLFRAGETYATALEGDGRLDAATAYLERLRTAAEAAPSRLPYLPVVVSLARCYREAGDIGRAVDVGERALERVQGLRLADVEGYAALVSTVAGAHQERGDLLRAQIVLDDLVALADADGSETDRAAAYWNAALLAVERGHAGDGLRLVEHADALLSGAADQRWRAMLQVTRSWVMLAQDPPRAEEARDLLRRSMSQIRQHAGALPLSSAQENLARCELLLGRPEVARRHAVAALRALEPSYRLERARALAVLGAASVALGEDAAGVESLESAAVLLQDSQAPRQAAAVWRQLGEVYRTLGDPGRALDALDRALDVVGVVREPLSPAVSATSPVGRRAPRAAPSPAGGPGAGTR